MAIRLFVALLVLFVVGNAFKGRTIPNRAKVSIGFGASAEVRIYPSTLSYQYQITLASKNVFSLIEFPLPIIVTYLMDSSNI